MTTTEHRDLIHLTGSWSAILGVTGPVCGAPASLDTTDALSLVTCPSCRKIAEAARATAVAAVSFPAPQQPIIDFAR